MDKSKPKITSSEQTEPQLDWFILICGSALLAIIVLGMIFEPQSSLLMINQAFSIVTKNFGIFYILLLNTIIVFLAYLILSKKGSIKLGSEGEGKEYSNFSWIAMLFCTGIGAAVIYWGATEWTFYYINPPQIAQDGQTIIWAASYGAFHWGPLTWSIYSLTTVAFCVSYHHKNIPSLRLSAACAGFLGSYQERWPGRIIDLFFIIGLIGTSATGLAFGVDLVTASIAKLTGLQNSQQLQLTIMLLVTLIIAFSVYKGLNNGIRILSVINARLALLLLLFIFIFGPSQFILEMSLATLGLITQNFFTMVTWSDPLEKNNFVENWTVFYVAWAMALGPFIGMFIAKISRGRTIREVILGMMGWGSLGCFLFFAILGNYAIHLELNGIFPVTQSVNDIGQTSTIAAIIELLPLGSFLLLFIAIIGIIFAATTYDSATYTLAAGTSREIKPNQHPSLKNRMYWAFALGSLPSALLFIGGLEPLKAATILASFPLLIIYVILMISIHRMLK